MGERFTTSVDVVSPEYFRGFRCKCGACRSVCCQGWRITLSEEEYFRLMGLRCSPSLRVSLDAAFAVFEEASPGRYAYISPGEDGRCRILDGEGWCSLHRECGEGVQPAVCRLYPRSIKPGEVTEACCSGSCEAVIEGLMHPRPLSFVRETLSVQSELPPVESPDEKKIERRRRAMELWQESGEPLDDRMAHIGAFLGVRDDTPERDAALLSSAVRIFRVLGSGSPSLAAAAAPILRVLALSGDAEVDIQALARYREAERCTAERLREREQWLSNIVANHMFYMQFPYVGEGASPVSAWDGLYAAYAVLRVSTACAADRVAFADTAAAALRCIEHTDFYHNAHIILRGTK